MTNSAGVSFQACAPDDGAAADIGPAQGIDADSIQVGEMCMAKPASATYSVICPAGASVGSGCSCQDPNTGETVAGRVAKVGQYTN